MQRSSKKRSVNDTRKIRVRTPVIHCRCSMFSFIRAKAGNPFVLTCSCRAFPLGSHQGAAVYKPPNENRAVWKAPLLEAFTRFTTASLRYGVLSRVVRLQGRAI